MKIKTISYKRVRSLEPYNNETVEMTAELEEDEDQIKAALHLKETVLISLGLIKPTTEEKKPSTNTDDNDIAW